MNETTPPKAGAREWIGLAVLALPSLLVAIDLFVLLLALPTSALTSRRRTTSSCGSSTCTASCWPAS
nr:hypothetical protein [Phytohabitans houttuyneae]